MSDWYAYQEATCLAPVRWFIESEGSTPKLQQLWRVREGNTVVNEWRDVFTARPGTTQEAS